MPILSADASSEWGNKFNTTYYDYYSLDDSDDEICYNFTVHHTGYIQNLSVYAYAVIGDPPAYNIGLKNTLSGTWLVNTTYDFTTSGWHSIQLPTNYSVTTGDFLMICIGPLPKNPPDAGNRTAFSYLTPYIQIIPYNSSSDPNYDTCYYDTDWNCGVGTPVFVITYNDTYEEGQPWGRATYAEITNTTFRAEKITAFCNMSVSQVSVFVKSDGSVDNDLEVQILDSDGNILTKAFIQNTSISTSYSWQSCAIDVNLTFGNQYYIALAAPNITVGNLSLIHI